MSQPGLPIVRLLRLAAGSRIVFQTHHAGHPAVARVLARPVPLELDEPVRRAVCKGGDIPSGLDAEQAGFLSGCRARARLGVMPGLPDLVAAGVAPLSLPGLSRAGERQGHIHLIAHWIEGRPLGEAAPTLSIESRLGLLENLLRLLDRIHAGHVAYGGVTPKNIVFDGQAVWLVDVACPRLVLSRDPLLAGDVLAFGRVARSLLAPEHLPASSAWPGLIRACLASDPRARPTVPQLLAHAGLAPPSCPAGDTIHVSDPTAFSGPGTAPGAMDPPTEFVADPIPRSSRRPGWGILRALLDKLRSALGRRRSPG